jgi:hypothetical protein
VTSRNITFNDGTTGYAWDIPYPLSLSYPSDQATWNSKLVAVNEDTGENLPPGKAAIYVAKSYINYFTIIKNTVHYVKWIYVGK